MILSLLGLGMVLGGMSAPCIQEVEHQEVVFHQENKKLANYDDDQNFITLTAYELNNYTWDNLNEFMFDEYDYEEYAPSTYMQVEYNDVSMSFTTQESETDYYYFVLDDSNNNFIRFNDLDRNDNKFKFYTYDSVEGDYVEGQFTHDLLLMIDEEFIAYENIKGYIEQDIVDNTNSMPSIADIFTEVTSAISAFVGSLGQAFTSITALFYDSTNSQWTFLGVLILIGVGVGLVYGVYRIIKGLLHRV